jgi:alanyl-tRNA synthetase
MGLERVLAVAKKMLALGGGGGAAPSADEEIGGVKFSGQVLHGMNPKELRGLLDEAKARLGSGVAAIVAVNDGRASVAAAVTDDLTGRISAVDLVRAAVEALGGQGGGGRPDMAQGGGPDGAKAEQALAAVRTLLAAEPVTRAAPRPPRCAWPRRHARKSRPASTATSGKARSPAISAGWSSS